MSRNKRINFVCPDEDNLKIQYVRIKFFKTPLNQRWIKFLKITLDQVS